VGFKIVEYYIRQVLDEGIAALRKDVDQLDVVFADLLCPPLGNVFGKKILDEIKCFFKDNDVPVLSAYNQNQIPLPSVVVHLISSQEDPQYRAMQDHVGYERSPKQATQLAGPLYAKSYDPITGKLTFLKETDLTQFIAGRKLFARREDTVYTLVPTFMINDATAEAYERTEQYCHIVDAHGDIPEFIDFSELYLLSSIDFVLHRVAAVYFRETFEIRVNTSINTDQAIWLYYIISYILMRNKDKFEEVGLETQTFSTSEFTRDIGKMPNNIWGRTLRFSFLVQHTWKEEIISPELVSVNINVETNVTRVIASEGY
jgi:hypothetical protein